MRDGSLEKHIPRLGWWDERTSGAFFKRELVPHATAQNGTSSATATLETSPRKSHDHACSGRHMRVVRSMALAVAVRRGRSRRAEEGPPVFASRWTE